MEPINFEKKFSDLAKQNQERQANEGEVPSSKKKLCPLMSRFNEPVWCAPGCKFYREKDDLKNFECVFQELQCISWNTRKKK
jgi:hypothetical protein